MKSVSTKVMGWALVATLLGATLATGPAAAQSQLDVAQAQAFMGQWVVNMDTEYGPFSMNLAIADQGGKVAATMSSAEMGGDQAITDITRSEESLVLRFTGNAQGQTFDVAIALVPNGENLDVYFDVAQGMFTAQGVGTRAS
jgi:hypothetical protein